MTQQELQQKISEYFAKLPKEAQDIFSSMTWMDTVNTVAVKYNLTDSQKEALATETSLALLGIIHPDQYEENLIAELGIPQDKISTMISEIDRQVFATIRPALVNVFANNIESVAVAKYGDNEALDKRFANLPIEVQEAIADSQYQKNLYTIAGKYSLGMNDMEALDEVTTKVMLGVIASEEYSDELSRKIILPKETIIKLVQDVNEMVFKNIRSFLMKQTTQKQEEESVVEESIPIPPYKKVEYTVPSNLPIIEKIKPSSNDTMANSGIEILKDTNKDEKADEDKVTMKEDSIMVHSGIAVMQEAMPMKEEHMLPNTETQKSVLAGIENPPPAPMNIMDMKLRKATSTGTTTVTHTVAKDPTTTPAPSAVDGLNRDPYHEAI